MSPPALARLVMVLPGMLILTLLAGFGWFLHLATAPTQVPRTAEGIVAFTGGADRVATALRLLAEGNGRILLVSGAGTGTGFPSLARLAGVDPALSRRVTIGHEAATTHGNALETARWARQHDVRSLIVVTAFYHMPRAMAELSDALPGVALAPVSVRPRLAPNEELRLLVSEYAKWLALQVGVSGDALRRDALPVEAGAADAARRGGG